MAAEVPPRGARAGAVSSVGMPAGATGAAAAWVCTGCGAVVDPANPYPFRCPNVRPGDDIDHVLQSQVDGWQASNDDPAEPHPFVRWRSRLHAWHVARAGGMPEADWRDRVLDLDARVRRVDGRGFVITPFARADALSRRLGFSDVGGVWLKDETGNVAGSHKARHLMGVALWLLVMEQLGRTSPRHRPPLAIASCGNAALAAAVLASAMAWPLRVFGPAGADGAVLARLDALGAAIVPCRRDAGVAGDPCVHAFRHAVDDGCLPFTCQGRENGLAIEGGETLTCEVLSSAAVSGVTFDRLFVQVGGGALASACVRAIRAAGPARAPRLQPVQTTGCAPFMRAFERVRGRLAHGATRAEVMREAAGHRSRFMWPWEPAPRGVAEGILDDETYDWREVVAGVFDSGGAPVVVDDARVREAQAVVRDTTPIVPSATGAAGLAGLLELQARSDVGRDERVVVLITGGEGQRGAST